MKGLLLTLLTPTAFAQVQVRTIAPVALPAMPTLDAAPVTPNNLSGLGSFEVLAPLGSELGAMDGQLGGLHELQPLGSAGHSSLTSSLGQLGGRYEAEAAQGSLSGLGTNAALFDGSLSQPAFLGLNAAPEDEGTLERPQQPLGSSLGRLYPRVAFIADVLEGPASDDLIRHIDVLQQKGVQIVFLTDRPDRGPDSVQEVLTNRLKGRRDAPILVVSEGGAKIYKHSGQAENPRPIIENTEGFSELEWAAIGTTVEKVAKAMKVKARASEFPEKEAFSYLVRVGPDADKFATALTKGLKREGLPYKAEAENGLVTIRSMQPHLAAPRVLKALETLTHRDMLSNPREALVLADPKRDAKFLRALPEGAYIHAVKDVAGLKEALVAVLGADSLQKVSVERNKIRSYMDFSTRDQRRGGSYSGPRNPVGRDMAFYKGIVMYELMGRLYRDLRNGQYHLATLEAAKTRLRSMWRHPKKNWVRIPSQIEKAMGRPAWYATQRGGMDTAIAWLANYYGRHFADFPNGVLENVVQTLANLASDGKSLITVELRAPYTGRRYLVHVRPARAELHKGMQGPELVATAYRFGQEKPGEQDDVEAKLLALAMLKGYATKGEDGQLLVNGQPISIVRVNFEYTRRTLPKSFRVSELVEAENELTSMIERMEADAAFQAHYQKEQEKAKPSAKKGKGKKSPKAKRTTTAKRSGK